MHTPGPWFVRDRRSPEMDRRIAHHPNEQLDVSAGIARVYGSNATIGLEEGEANARLIAAAPKLLEALEGLVLEYGIDVTSVKLLTDRCRSVWGRAGAAIAEAKGE